MTIQASSVREDKAAVRLERTVETIVSDIEAFKWERVAEPVWAARVEVAAVYFRKRANRQVPAAATARAA
jgi:hypothetical protein